MDDKVHGLASVATDFNNTSHAASGYLTVKKSTLGTSLKSYNDAATEDVVDQLAARYGRKSVQAAPKKSADSATTVPKNITQISPM